MTNIFTAMLDKHELATLHKLDKFVFANHHLSLKQFLVREMRSGDAMVMETTSPEFKGLTLWQ